MNKELKIELFDNLTIDLKIKSKDVNVNDVVLTKKEIIIGFNQIDRFVEDFIINQSNLILDKEYKFHNKDKTFNYILKILKHKKISKAHRMDRQALVQMKMNEMKYMDEITKYLLKINELKQQIEKLDEQYKQSAQVFQQKAQTELNKLKEQTYQHTQEEIAHIKKYALQDFFEEFLLVLNNLEVAANSGLNSTNSEVQAYTKGFAMLLNKIELILSNYNVTKITPLVGEIFDANVHQIFELQDADKQKDSILKVKSIGYKLHDRVIKPALVIVQK
ncbi:nucleotide exchange factor GrpE [Mycoplasma phocoenae]|uniref:Protein GrpE n=1 Tax=Mycoplasma phocoenae TaxID=754517 RepID=A0A858U7L9_9MOLU|nr:nucleotide exchange factor GrpE [Mycoplasma phocoenae]QJG67245.1 nucleotide exchange factor GrpE [Mycoplasma phocoenae]